MPHVQEVVRPLRLLPFIIPICFALASSLSWRGNARSIPPEWMSIYLPSVSDAMAERSMCHPGARPAWLPRLGRFPKREIGTGPLFGHFLCQGPFCWFTNRPKCEHTLEQSYSGMYSIFQHLHHLPKVAGYSDSMVRALCMYFPAASNVSISKYTEPSERYVV